MTIPTIPNTAGYHKKMCKNDKVQMKEGDVVSLKIYSEHTKVLDYHLITHIVSTKKGVVEFSDLLNVVIPEDSFGTEEIDWDITISELTQKEIESYAFRKLGVIDDFPEYKL